MTLARRLAACAPPLAPEPAAPTRSPNAANVYFRAVESRDRREFLELVRASRELHWPWISPPSTPQLFRRYLRRAQSDEHEAFAVCRGDTGAIVGVVNINNILRGSMLSGTVSYYAAEAHARQGFMRAGLLQVKDHAFRTLGLHRLEANIQAANVASIALASGCGFQLEGVARRLLYINGAWRDHQRWAAIDHRRSLDFRP